MARAARRWITSPRPSTPRPHFSTNSPLPSPPPPPPPPLSPSRPEPGGVRKRDERAGGVVQNENWKYVHFAASAPLFFDLRRDPSQLDSVAGQPEYAAQQLVYAQKMLNWRLQHAERTLTGYAASPQGLRCRR